MIGFALNCFGGARADEVPAAVPRAEAAPQSLRRDGRRAKRWRCLRTRCVSGRLLWSPSRPVTLRSWSHSYSHLQADLGVDTVKQAELFATVREAYGIARDDTLAVAPSSRPSTT